MKIVILTGSGISAESGLGTFRDEGGLWSEYDLEDVATPDGFARDPHLVHGFYNARRANCLDAQPNAAHWALARLQDFTKGDTVIVTQNIDDLHERAGTRRMDHRVCQPRQTTLNPGHTEPPGVFSVPQKTAGELRPGPGCRDGSVRPRRRNPGSARYPGTAAP